MIATALLILFTVLQFFSGLGLLSLFRIRLRQALFIPLALMLGVVVFSVMPFLLQLLYIPLTRGSVFLSLILAAIALNYKYKTIATYLNYLRRPALRFPIYELPFLIIILLLVIISIWRCYYLPPSSRDFTSGVEAVADYAAREKTMINSVYSVNLESTNNPFKSPYITSLQVIYKYAGFPFGQLWLSVLFLSFLIFLYQYLREHLHPILTGLLIITFLAIPEMYGYTYMVLYDYSNAIFFCLSVYFMTLFFENRKRRYLWFSATLMGIATYIRSETLVLGAFMAIPILIKLYRQKVALWETFITEALFILPSLVAYAIPVSLYINWYLPVQYSIDGQINKHLTDLTPLFTRFAEMNCKIIFSKLGMEYYSYFFFFFLLLLGLDLFFIRSWPPKLRVCLFAIGVIYLGLPFLGYLLPLLDLYNSTKRGLFKLFPLAILYMAYSPSLILITQKILAWERKPS